LATGRGPPTEASCWTEEPSPVVANSRAGRASMATPIVVMARSFGGEIPRPVAWVRRARAGIGSVPAPTVGVQSSGAAMRCGAARVRAMVPAGGALVNPGMMAVRAMPWIHKAEVTPWAAMAVPAVVSATLAIASPAAPGRGRPIQTTGSATAGAARVLLTGTGAAIPACRNAAVSGITPVPPVSRKRCVRTARKDEVRGRARASGALAGSVGSATGAGGLTQSK
jgi:hypothetical protein